MFVAIDQEGMMINVAEKKWSRQRLMKLRSERSFICPTCKQEVDLKIGSIIAAHFAHKKYGECSTVKGNYESEYHMKGKHDLYHWFHRQHGIESVQLEPYIQETRQRPDLYIEYNQRKIAIEYQCSTIDMRSFKKRSQLYKQEGISYLWILGAKTLTRVGKQSYQLSPFQWNFVIKKKNAAPYLYAYCPNLRSIIVLYHILPFSSRTVISEHKHYPLPATSFQDVMKLQTHNKGNLRKEWLQKIKKFRLKPPGFQSKQSSRFHQYLYQMVHLPPSYLPSYAFLPLVYNYIFESPVYVWQGLILLFIQSIPLYGSFRVHDVYYAISMRMNDGFITVRSLTEPVSFITAIDAYLKKLAVLKVVVFDEKELLKKVKEIRWITQMDELLLEDTKIISTI
ncbi:competence protein CoiA family protein [Metabacillus schmidteae]|uniref:competence protein CoiA family protein n=1 Tax=Metabacillus schmidteae TaxID=2730405 RepID=UPI00158D1EB5|nr:competence protein CoiA family protein [Metabacillus schmidteae]